MRRGGGEGRGRGEGRRGREESTAKPSLYSEPRRVVREEEGEEGEEERRRRELGEEVERRVQVMADLKARYCPCSPTAVSTATDRSRVQVGGIGTVYVCVGGAWGERRERRDLISVFIREVWWRGEEEVEEVDSRSQLPLPPFPPRSPTTEGSSDSREWE